MCNRYVSPDQAAIERYWQVGRGDPWHGAPDIFPRAPGPFIRAAAAANDRQSDDAHAGAPERELVVGQWGLIPWVDKFTVEIFESYTMLTVNADHHPLMASMHKPDPQLPPDRQDKRSVVPIDLSDVDAWLCGSNDEAASLVRVPPVEVFDAAPQPRP
ncbi:MAG: hypothetical protein K0B16_05320 [Burkholderiaceae bacterium]|nr:hypothetical protein [Burkholderiaceae bacterium]